MTLFDPINLRRDIRHAQNLFMGKFLKPNTKVYDIGCGNKPFLHFVESKSCEYIGVDIADGFYDPSQIDLVGSAYSVPIPDATAGAIISCQVLEHLERPLDALDEAARILQPDGLLFLSFPFMYPIHAMPHDFGRYTNYFMEPALRERGFEILKKTEIGGFWYCTGMFFGLYLQNFDRGPLKRFKITKFVIFLAKGFFRIFHELERAALRLLGKNADTLRAPWVVAYVLVARRKNQEL